jgi:hypothetical protein
MAPRGDHDTEAHHLTFLAIHQYYSYISENLAVPQLEPLLKESQVCRDFTAPQIPRSALNPDVTLLALLLKIFNILH